MSRNFYFRSTLSLALIAFASVAGCQKQAEPNQKGDQTAQSKQVTIDVTGMS